jgi:RimJ/RimL family protein N-acetyltransferase
VVIDARHFEVRETLRNGSEICIRALHPDDGERMAVAFGQLDPESIYTRFFGPKAAVTDADFRLIREMDFDSRVALIATVIQDGHEVVIASSSYSRFDARTAEVAFIVEEDYRGFGIARRLLGHLGRIAVDRGLTSFEAEVLPHNRSMLRVFTACGWPMRTRTADGTVHVTLSLTASGGG